VRLRLHAFGHGGHTELAAQIAAAGWTKSAWRNLSGGIVALRPGTHYYRGELAIAIIATLVLVLRGRSLTDRVQAVTFFVGGFILLAGFTLVVVTGSTSPVTALP
jgi:hypothetical protein